MRSVTQLVTVVTAATLLLPGCAAVTDAVDEAGEFVDEGLQRLEWCTAAFRLGTAVSSRNVEAAANAVDDLEANAPEELSDELATIQDAIDAAEQGDLSQVEGEEVRDAGQRVLDTAESRCDPTTRPE